MEEKILFQHSPTKRFYEGCNTVLRKLLFVAVLIICSLTAVQSSAQSYCEPYSGYGYGQCGIYQLIVGNQNLTYSNAYQNSGYYGSTILSANYGTQTVSVSTFSASSQCFLRVYFDYNNDGIFGDGDLLNSIYNSPNYSMNNVPFAIPSSTTPGIHRMRIMTSYQTDSNPCSTTFGTVQDYPVNVICPDLMYADNDGDGYGSAVGITAICPIPANFVLNATDCNDSNSSAYPGATEVLYNGVDDNCNGQTDELTYCQPYNSNVQYAITNVAIGTINNYSPPFSNTNYSNFTAQSTDVHSGGAQTINVSTAYGNTSVAVYVDYNNDGDFYDADEAVASGNAAPILTADFTIPVTASLGAHRLRVVNSIFPFSSPCSSFQGEVEDYTINITGVMYLDADGDGYGTGAAVTLLSPLPQGYSLLLGDCDDANAGVQQTYAFYADNDGDYYGAGELVSVCAVDANTPPMGYASTNTDCNDTALAIHPNANEIPFNGIDENCNGIPDENGQLVTSLLASVCNGTTASIGSLIGITTLAGYPTITGYRIRATNGAQVQVIEKAVPNFTMQQFASFAYATTYTIDIELQRNGVWMGYYGPACQISTSAILAEGGAAQVSASQCGITVPKVNTLIATTSIQGVTGYRFRVTNLTDLTGSNQVQTVTRGSNWFTLQMLTRYNYGTTYRIEVAVETTGDFGGYGSPCEVSSPPAPALVNCSGSVALPTTAIACSNLTGITQYRFQVTRDSDGASTTIDRGNSFFTFNMVPAAVYTAGALYNVRVAVMTLGTWSPFGDACQIAAPAALGKPATAIASESMLEFKAIAYSNPFASDFGIEVDTPSKENISIKVYDMLGRMLESREIKVSEINNVKMGDSYPSGVYNVIVSQNEIVKTLRVIKR